MACPAEAGFSATRGIKNCRDSRLFKGFSPLQLLCNLTGNRPQSATFHTAKKLCVNKIIELPNSLSMKKTIFTSILCSIFQISHGQFGASLHQSNIPFIGLNYQINERLLPEFRIGTDNYFEDTSLELVFTYIFKNDEMVNAYIGVGGRIEIFQGVVVPLGMNIYPFEKKNFGFHMEVAGLIADEGNVLRGSWGIRYRFTKE
jgi:hypothetical protein